MQLASLFRVFPAALLVCAACGNVVVDRDGAGGTAGAGGTTGTGGDAPAPEPCAAEVCSTPQDESCDGTGECTGKTEWARDIETDAGNGAANAVAADPWGDVLVTGTFTGALEIAGLSLSSEDGTGYAAETVSARTLLDAADEQARIAREVEGCAFGGGEG